MENIWRMSKKQKNEIVTGKKNKRIYIISVQVQEHTVEETSDVMKEAVCIIPTTELR